MVDLIRGGARGDPFGGVLRGPKSEGGNDFCQQSSMGAGMQGSGPEVVAAEEQASFGGLLRDCSRGSEGRGFESRSFGGRPEPGRARSR